MRKERRTVGRFDGRFAGSNRRRDAEYDPSLSLYVGVYSGTFNDYVRRELKYETDAPYEILTGKVRPWSYGRAENRYVDVAETLRGAMTQNPYLKVFVAHGYYDLATPFAATKYTFARLQLDPEVRKNVSMDFFQGGHMMYIDRKAHAKLKSDIVDFIRGASNPQ
jgi:carboxypeptidase C (cathepsin A)